MPEETLAQVEALISARRGAAAVAELSRIVAAESARDFDWPRAINLARHLGDIDTALAAARKWARAGKKDPARRALMIELLMEIGGYEEAARLARELRKEAPADAQYLEGLIKARLGDFAGAGKAFRKALDAAPMHTPAWEHIALLRAYDDPGEDIDAMERLNRSPLPVALKLPLLFALGRAYDSQGDIKKAFARISEGARLSRAATPFSLAPQLAYIERLKQTFQQPLFDRHRGKGDGGEGLIFIVGAQRSGTTLVEQILGTSVAVRPTGEHTLLRLATHPLGNMEPQEMALASAMPAEEWRAMGSDYSQRVSRRYGPAAVYTDKTLINHFFAGAIYILFPAAKIVWCRRDPRDVVWSCYRTRMTANLWATDLDDAIAYVRGYDGLCAHWREQLGSSVFALQYEDLVRDPDRVGAALFDFCGVAPPENWREFYKSPRAVATASIAQVREPLKPDAIGSWRRYEEYLGPTYRKYFG